MHWKQSVSFSPKLSLLYLSIILQIRGYFWNREGNVLKVYSLSSNVIIYKSLIATMYGRNNSSWPKNYWMQLFVVQFKLNLTSLFFCRGKVNFYLESLYGWLPVLCSDFSFSDKCYLFRKTLTLGVFILLFSEESILKLSHTLDSPCFSLE